MAIGDKSDFTLRDEEFESIYKETLAQNVQIFNSNLANTIRMVSQEMEGDYMKDRFFDRPSGGYVRRDDTDTSTSLTPSTMTQDEHIGVKLKRRYGPYRMTEDAWYAIGRDPMQFSALLAENFAEEKVKETANTAIKALVNAIGNVSALVYDYAATGSNATLDHTALVRGKFKMGDKANRIRAWVTHSGATEDLHVEQLSAASGNVADFQIYSGGVGTLGLPLFTTDSSDLTVSGTPGEFYVLGLVEGAADVFLSRPPLVAVDQQLGKENIERIVQGEDDYVLALKGFKWDVSNGGANPVAGDVGTGTNWDTVVASHKDQAGVRIDVDQS